MKTFTFQFILKTLFCITLVIIFSSCDQKAEKDIAYWPQREVVMEDLVHPWSIAFINKDEALITEKDRDLLHVNIKTKERTIITGFPEDIYKPHKIDVSLYPPRVYPSSVDGKSIWANCGKLDIVLDPSFDSTGRIFLSYVSEMEKTYALKVISAELKGDTLYNIKTILLAGPYTPGLWHFGGGLCIVENQLYITVGERLFYEDFKVGLAVAQDFADARGAIYRFNLDGSIPIDNPDFGTDGIPGMYAFGIRAAQGITYRHDKMQIWFSEHGTIQGDEINKLVEGANYGWPNITTGKWRSPDYKPASLENPIYTDPVHFWKQTVAPTGLSFYSGHEFPSWKGNLIVPGLSNGSLWRFVLEEDDFISGEELFLNERYRSRKVMQSPDGHLYQLTDEDNGKLLRITNKTM